MLFLNVVMIAARVRVALVTTNGGIESFEINVWENYFEISDFSSF